MADSTLENVLYVIYSTDGCMMTDAIHKRLKGEPRSKNFYFQDLRDLPGSPPAWVQKSPTLVDIQSKMYCEGIECLFFVENELKKPPPQDRSALTSHEKMEDNETQDFGSSFAETETFQVDDRKSQRLNEHDLLEKIRSHYQAS